MHKREMNEAYTSSRVRRFTMPILRFYADAAKVLIFKADIDCLVELGVREMMFEVEGNFLNSFLVNFPNFFQF